MFFESLLVILTSFMFSFLATPWAIKFAKRFGLVTDKKSRKHPAHTHTGIIPRGGGIPIFTSLFICILIFLPVSAILIRILIASFIILIVGILDDKYDLSPYLRFFLNILAASVVVSAGLGIPFISNPLGGVIKLDTLVWEFSIFGEEYKFLILANFLAIIWLTSVMNFINWSKGVDGQLPGFVGIGALFLGILAQRFTGHNIETETVTVLSFIIAGAYFGFLPFNFYPQKIMPGYSGGALAGFLLGILSILSFGKLGTAILVLSIPMIDAVYTLLRRIVKRTSPFRGDKGHFHHKLLEIGWGRRRIAVFYWLISIILGTASLFLNGIEKLVAFLSVAVTLTIFMVAIEKVKKINST